LRVEKEVDGSAVRFAYDTAGRLLSEDSSAGRQEWVYAAGEPIALVVDQGAAAPGKVFLLGTDQVGTPTRAFDAATGAIAWAADYEAFGRAWEYVPGSRTGTEVTVNVRFPGQYLDRETGLHYNWHRYYDPDTGRYLQPDPLALTRPGWDQPVYAYGMNNPLGYYDLLGLACVGPVWRNIGVSTVVAHKESGEPRSLLQFHLTCDKCEKITNIHFEYGALGGAFALGQSLFGGDAPVSEVSRGGSDYDLWLLAQMRSTMAVIQPGADVKTCYDCAK
jgi:RHS repeat-associated protein